MWRAAACCSHHMNPIHFFPTRGSAGAFVGTYSQHIPTLQSMPSTRFHKVSQPLIGGFPSRYKYRAWGLGSCFSRFLCLGPEVALPWKRMQLTRALLRTQSTVRRSMYPVSTKSAFFGRLISMLFRGWPFSTYSAFPTEAASEMRRCVCIDILIGSMA